MSFAPQHLVEEELYSGAESTCVLLRVKPDLINTAVQPVATAEWAGVMCGYYFSPEQTASSNDVADADSAQRLLRDVGLGGPDVLTRADGTYAFLQWDTERECLLAGVDKLGMRPLYWAQLPDGGFVAASELKAIIALIPRVSPNWLAWEEKFTFSFVFGNHTLVDGVNRLGPAQVCRFAERKVTLYTLEDFFGSIDIIDRSVDDFLEEQESVFDAAMRGVTSLFRAPEQSMLTLSAGFDSRRVLAWLLRNDVSPTIYTVPEVLPDGREYESALVRDMCQQAGLDGWRVYPDTAAEAAEVTRLRDLLSDFQSDDHYFTTMLAMSLGCVDRVNYDGLAAGVIIGGVFTRSEYLQPGGNDKFLRDWPRPLSSWLKLPGSKRGAGVTERVRGYLNVWGDNPNRFSYFYLLSRTRSKVGLAPLAFQANAFESVYPYLGREMLKSALSFPVEKKLGAHLQAKLIARYNTVLSNVPTSHDPIRSVDPKYFTNMGSIERREKVNTLKRALTAVSSIDPCTISPTQKARFLAAYVLRGRIGEGVFNWEAGKANKVGQLAHFLRIAESTSTYSNAVRDLHGVFGSRPQWCRPL